MTADRVLVVDDSFENRLVAAGHLEAAGFDVACAENGADALAHLEANGADLVVLDVLMPGIDGYETCRRIRANPATAAIPVLFLTALGDRETTEPAIAAGGDDILGKPFSRAEMLLRVRALLRQRRTIAELRKVTDELAEQNARLRRLEEQRRDMATLLAHDLKGPLTAVVANVDALAAFAFGPDERELVDDIRVGSLRACSMIRDLVDVSCAEDTALVVRPERFAIADLVAEVVAVIRGLGRDERVRLRSDVPASELVADRGLVSRVIENLAINALHHAPDGTDVTIRVEADPDGIIIGVHDDGSGVPAGEVEHIFDKYVTREAPRAQRRGHGLGLVFCKLAAEAHGGRVWTENRPSGGASFYVHLPQPKAAPAPCEQADVLVVDDEALTRKAIERALRRTCTVESVSAGDEAVARFRAGARYALVLCDVAMPRLGGLEVLDILRREAPEQVARFVFVTGGARAPADEQRLATSGVPILDKPFDRSQLMELVEKYVGTRHARSA